MSKKDKYIFVVLTPKIVCFCHIIPQNMPSKISEVRRVAAMRQDIFDTIKGVLEDYIHAYTCLLGKGWKTLVLHDYSEKVSLFL